MAITESLPSTVAQPPAEVPAVRRPIIEAPIISPEERGDVLRHVLDDLGTPGSYEYATSKESGHLLDAFEYNPETGKDAVLHILSGNVVRFPDTGATVTEGFHHEASALVPDTYVDHERVARHKNRRPFRQNPFEPYQTEVKIHGMEKGEFVRDDEGEIEFVGSRSTMFPKEYDALAVLVTVKRARDEYLRMHGKLEGDEPVVADTRVKLLDGESTMGVRLILDPKTGKIIAALPQTTPNGQPAMKNVSIKAINEYLGAGDPTEVK